MKIVSLAELPEEGVSHNPEIRKQVVLRRGDVPHVNAFARARLTPGQAVRAHAHADMHEVFFVLAGAGRIEVDGRTRALAPGTCVAVAPGESHRITNTGADELVLLYFGVEAAC